ncbi:cation transporter [Sulfurifustis variabilis]|uniref:Cation transporter n=1 Tax=Sulfurifustis variabilis TaxID=1675686 RepID=A0A1B4VG43_9GAMM|nr:YHS domain-containing protein [Sulfurifustis variabilis]BAU49757.1 cation transporter [Sulfurifustis variabilis]
MDWLSQNWLWLVLAAGAALFLLRRGGGHVGGHGGGLVDLLGGIGRGHGGGRGHGSGHGGHEERSGHADRAGAADAPEAAIDPVSGEAVRTAQALTSVHGGKVYYFASKENRDRFEAAPQEYAHEAVGHPVHPAEAARERPRRRGC